jgi:hypothetical protein
VQKAMARDPEERYQSPDEMVEALFGTDSVRDGASGFDSGSLTMIARRAVEKSHPMPATLVRDFDALNVSPRQKRHHPTLPANACPINTDRTPRILLAVPGRQTLRTQFLSGLDN